MLETWLINQWDRVRNSLWFIPTFGLVISLFAAVLMLNVDATVRAERLPSISWATTTASAAMATMTTLAGSLVGVTGVVFSITMLTLAQTSSMYGSRLLRSFLNHNIAQVTLATFLGTSLYCFTILWAIRGDEDLGTFVPHLSVGVGLIGGMLSFVVFISFINHVAEAIQATNVVRSVAHDLSDAIDRLFPEEIGHSREDHQDASDEDAVSSGSTIRSTKEGYLQAIDGETLLHLARKEDLIIQLRCRPGDFLIKGMPIAAASATADADEINKEINQCFLVGSRRTPRQDVECAILELVEVAVRALSPGINDPQTAIACLNYLGASMAKLAQREFPDPCRRDKDGNIRVIAFPLRFPSAFSSAFEEIRRHAKTSFSVTVHLIRVIGVLAHQVRRTQDREAVLQFLNVIEREATDCPHDIDDKTEILVLVNHVRQTLDCESSSAELAS
ncbi:DUF2254 domain-containing protein [Thalassoglobus sp. JC818]|uniref:DUF2254 domain-containing protein n=1 Tax=Thalassoglobus sp. JC818 TaxID=3232136 RepID=UPI00345B330D